MHELGSDRHNTHGSVGGACHQASRIKQMLGAILPHGPAEAWFELYSEKIADLPKHTVTDPALQLTFRITDPEGGLSGNWSVNLDAGA